MLTKKDFKKIAEILNKNYLGDKPEVIQDFIDWLKEQTTNHPKRQPSLCVPVSNPVPA